MLDKKIQEVYDKLVEAKAALRQAGLAAAEAEAIALQQQKRTGLKNTAIATAFEDVADLVKTFWG